MSPTKYWCACVPQMVLTITEQIQAGGLEKVLKGSIYWQVEPLWTPLPSFCCWPVKGILRFRRWLEMDWGCRSSLRITRRPFVCFRSTCHTYMDSAFRKRFELTFQVRALFWTQLSTRQNQCDGLKFLVLDDESLGLWHHIWRLLGNDWFSWLMENVVYGGPGQPGKG